MHRFANAHSEFFMCEFSNLGFIGRLFHNGEDLTHFAYFVLLLYRSQPVDWILSKFISAKFCSLDDTAKQCMKKRVFDVVLFRRSVPLFQHIGRHSSLPGKFLHSKSHKGILRSWPTVFATLFGSGASSHGFSSIAFPKMLGGNASEKDREQAAQIGVKAVAKWLSKRPNGKSKNQQMLEQYQQLVMQKFGKNNS